MQRYPDIAGLPLALRPYAYSLTYSYLILHSTRAMKSSTLLAALLSGSMCFSQPLETSPAQHVDGDIVASSNEAELDKRAIDWTQIVISAACVRICPGGVSLIRN